MADSKRGASLVSLVRAGFAARGLSYGIIGILAVKLSLGQSSARAANQQGALETMVHEPLGKVLLSSRGTRL
jgi:hypothetical protein